jgi:hypothetical protein
MATTTKTTQNDARNGDLSAPLDVLLTEATYSPRQRFFAADATLRLGTSLARNPGAVASRAAGFARDITPWENCQRTAQMLGGNTRFVFSTSGHIAAIVNPPGNPKASYRVAVEGEHDDPEAWLAETEKRSGSWWEDWDGWLVERSGPVKPAPRRLGSRDHRPKGKAPGTYVLAN